MEISFDQKFGLKLTIFHCHLSGGHVSFGRQLIKSWAVILLKVPVPCFQGAMGNQDSPQNALHVSTLAGKWERSSEAARQMLHDVPSTWFA